MVSHHTKASLNTIIQNVYHYKSNPQSSNVSIQRVAMSAEFISVTSGNSLDLQKIPLSCFLTTPLRAVGFARLAILP